MIKGERQNKGLEPGRRICVVGTSGSGKTTLAKELAEKLSLKRVELDALHWEKDWVEAPDTVFRERVSEALAGQDWICDGNYSKARDITWTRSDTVIWLDYSLPVILTRLLKRSLARAFSKELLWGKNRENFVTLFFSKDSLFLWAIHTHPKYRREYCELISDKRYEHVRFIRLASPEQCMRFLDGLK